jgi:hypothetical protein
MVWLSADGLDDARAAGESGVGKRGREEELQREGGTPSQLDGRDGRDDLTLEVELTRWAWRRGTSTIRGAFTCQAKAEGRRDRDPWEGSKGRYLHSDEQWEGTDSRRLPRSGVACRRSAAHCTQAATLISH